MAESYRLTLADGVTWGLLAPSSVQPWLESLARIMELPALGSTIPARHLRFVERSSAGLTAVSRGEEWKRLALGTAMRVWWHDGGDEAVVEVDPELLAHPEIRIIAMWTALRPIQFHAVAAGGGPFHATLAAHEGRGVLIAAPAGMGKSTCYRRLPPPWEPLCDDFALVVSCGEGRYRAHPFPTFSEYLESKSSRTWPSPRSVPVDAVFFLEHGLTDHVAPLATHLVPTMVFDAQQQLLSTVLSRLNPVVAQDLRARLFENACAMAGALPAYRLTATLTGRFWEHIEAVLPHCP